MKAKLMLSFIAILISQEINHGIISQSMETMSTHVGLEPPPQKVKKVETLLFLVAEKLIF